MSKKKLLIHEVFEQGKRESGKDAKSGIAAYLWSYFDDHFSPGISDKTFVRYYDAFLRDGKDVNIDPDTLNKLSKYVGYKNFDDFSRTFIKKEEDANKTTVNIGVDEDKESITEKLSKIIINITNEQNFKMPEFLTKQSNLGIMGLIILGGYLVGGTDVFKMNIKTPEIIQNKQPGFAKLPECMYWDIDRYKPAYCDDKNPSRDLIPIDTVQLKYFRKIMRKDTLTLENAIGKIWYSKYYGEVEFFTDDGKDPENGRELKEVTIYIIRKYANVSE